MRPLRAHRLKSREGAAAHESYTHGYTTVESRMPVNSNPCTQFTGLQRKGR